MCDYLPSESTFPPLPPSLQPGFAVLVSRLRTDSRIRSVMYSKPESLGPDTTAAMLEELAGGEGDRGKTQETKNKKRALPWFSCEHRVATGLKTCMKLKKGQEMLACSRVS